MDSVPSDSEPEIDHNDTTSLKNLQVGLENELSETESNEDFKSELNDELDDSKSLLVEEDVTPSSNVSKLHSYSNLYTSTTQFKYVLYVCPHLLVLNISAFRIFEIICRIRGHLSRWKSQSPQHCHVLCAKKRLRMKSN